MDLTHEKKTMPYAPLKIIAEDHEDLKVIAACLQDALIPLSGMEYDVKQGHFHIVANRFCWECEPETLEGQPYYARVVSGLAFHHVKEVQKKCLDLHNENELVNLLTIHNMEDGCVHLIFSGGSEIKLKVDKLCCHLKDVNEPYPTSHKPSHTT
ncbi:MAG: DUF2948 family protein [Alphaproteobacteria bacterium]|nr:DUF2948 family protein [Alphaproteobacteria bacterium]